jgi:hypothetical protein
VYLLERIFALRALIAAAMTNDGVCRTCVRAKVIETCAKPGCVGLRVGEAWVECDGRRCCGSGAVG